MVVVSESKLCECENALRRLRRIWPQYDIDGVHNIWIVKPGDKSKGIGQWSSFIDKQFNVKTH